MSDEQRAGDDAIYAIDRAALDKGGPSVVSVYGVVAYRAVTAFLVWRTGLHEPQPDPLYVLGRLPGSWGTYSWDTRQWTRTLSLGICDKRCHFTGSFCDAGERTRTSKGISPPAPKAGVSTNSTTPAGEFVRSVAAARVHSRRRWMYRHGVSAEAGEGRPPGVIITHPNRDKPVVQATRATVVVLLLVSAGLVLVVTIGGWSVLEGALPVQIAYIVVYLTMAFFAARWNRGVLPVGAALAVILAIFALVAGPAWFARDKAGFAQPTLNAELLGLITLLVAPVQVLLIVFAMRGFNLGWNVELERREPSRRADPYAEAPPYPA